MAGGMNKENAVPPLSNIENISNAMALKDQARVKQHEEWEQRRAEEQRKAEEFLRAAQRRQEEQRKTEEQRREIERHEQEEFLRIQDEERLCQEAQEEEVQSKETVERVLQHAQHSKNCRGGGMAKQAELDEELRHRRQEENKKVQAWLKANGFKNVNDLARKRMSSRRPLHAAVQQNDAEIVRLLLLAGADPHLGNGKNQMPLETAWKLDKAGSHSAVIQVFADQRKV